MGPAARSPLCCIIAAWIAGTHSGAVPMMPLFSICRGFEKNGAGSRSAGSMRKAFAASTMVVSRPTDRLPRSIWLSHSSLRPSNPDSTT